MPRSIIQIGLHEAAQWSFLAEHNWLDYFEGKKHFNNKPTMPSEYQIPHFFLEDSEPFNFYGIDVDPESVAYLCNRYRHRKRVNWICVGVDNSIHLKKMPDRYKNSNYYKYNLENKYLVFITMKELLESLRLKTLDILAVDIDGYEHVIFENMRAWCLLPTFITVEYHEKYFMVGRDKPIKGKEHPDHDKEEFINKIIQNGYDLFNSVERIEVPPHILTEYQFLRKDFIDV